MSRQRRISPQEKKLRSYAKDRRNSYGEAGARSRFSIAKNKRSDWQRLRHKQNSFLQKTRNATAEDDLEIIEAALRAVKPRRWRKSPDRRLGQRVASKVLKQEELGMKGNSQKHRILKQAKRRWRKMSRYDGWNSE